jgi:transposase-like protein
MTGIRKKHSPEFKMKVAADALSSHETLSQLSSRHGVHPTEISRWKKQLSESATIVFSKRPVDKGYNMLLRDQNDLQLLVGKQALMLEHFKKKLGI